MLSFIFFMPLLILDLPQKEWEWICLPKEAVAARGTAGLTPAIHIPATATPLHTWCRSSSSGATGPTEEL